jgi:hypothetical protein
MMNIVDVRRLARSVFSPMQGDSDELNGPMFLSILWNNRRRNTTRADIVSQFGIRLAEFEDLSPMMVKFASLGVIVAVKEDGEEKYNLSEEFRELVLEEQTKTKVHVQPAKPPGQVSLHANELELAKSVVANGPADYLDDELKMVRILFNNNGPTTDQALSDRFNIQGERASLYIVFMNELIQRGVIVGGHIAGRDIYDLTKNFRELVNIELKKVAAAATPVREWREGDPIRPRNPDDYEGDTIGARPWPRSR